MVQQSPAGEQYQQVLYRKWRPRDFADIVGQEPITTTLQHVVETGTPAHAYLFSGPRGTGKTSTGRILAKALNCRPDIAGNVDAECENAYDEGRAFDLIEMDAASNRGIDEIRDLRENVGYAPAIGPYKVYLIDEAHMLTDAAFNALLKTLEEPPPHVIFILATTEPHRIPATISSRCQRFDFRRHTLPIIIGRLKLVGDREGVKATDEVYGLIARQATGSLRDAENLLDQLIAYHGTQLTIENVRLGLGLVIDARVEVVARAAIHRELAAGLTAITAARDDGISMKPFVHEVIYMLRNALLIKAGADNQLALTRDEIDDLVEMTSDVRTQDIVTTLSVFGKLDFSGDAYDSLPVEIALAELCTGINIGPERARPTAPSQGTGSTDVSGNRKQATRYESRGSSTTAEVNAISKSSPTGPRRDQGTPSQAAAAPGSRQAFIAPDEGEVSSELQALRSQWDEIRGVTKRLNFKAGALVVTAFPKSIEGDQVEIGFRYPNHVEQIRENENGGLLAALEQAISSAVQREVRVAPILWNELNNTGPAPARKTLGGHLVEEANELGAIVIEDED